MNVSSPRPDHSRATGRDDRPAAAPASPPAADLRGEVTTRADRSEHRRHAWLHEDLLA